MQLTPLLSLRKAQDPDNAHTYLVTDLGATLDILDNAVLLSTTQTLSNKTLINQGDITFSGTGRRINADMSNATVSNRLAFQTTTANSHTSLSILPNGTGNIAAVNVYNSSDPTNSTYGALNVTGTDVRLIADKEGTGTFGNLLVYTGGAERMRITSTGAVGIGTQSPGALLHVHEASGAGNYALLVSSPGPQAVLAIQSTGAGGGRVQLAVGGPGNVVGAGHFYINREGIPNGWPLVITPEGKVGIGWTVQHINLSSGARLIPALGMSTLHDSTYGSLQFWCHSWSYQPFFSFRSSKEDEGGRVYLQISAPGELTTGVSVGLFIGGTYVLRQISVGAPDSAGTGYRVLRVPN